MGMHVNGRRAPAFAVLAALAMTVAVPSSAQAQARAASRAQIQRGQYLATFGGCSDCHTPKMMTANGPGPDPAKLLSGHPADLKVPPVPAGTLGPDAWTAVTNQHLTAWVGPWGTSFAANLTPDKGTGLGTWTYEKFSMAMRTGKHQGNGRPILPPMPWFDIAALNDADLRALFAYLQSIKPIENKVPDPIPPK